MFVKINKKVDKYKKNLDLSKIKNFFIKYNI